MSLTANWETLDIIPVASAQPAISYDITGKTKITVNISSLSKGYYLAVLKRRSRSPVTIRFMKI
ncbi:hypothetical protein [Chitinophaga filiformis]|uniref:hypothetical protein n=1 Tax=Chitinophaga filiformis TaxID=104663 RepID=UPI00373FCCD7